MSKKLIDDDDGDDDDDDDDNEGDDFQTPYSMQLNKTVPDFKMVEDHLARGKIKIGLEHEKTHQRSDI